MRRIDVDAAILFSDLLLPLEPMGLPFDFIKGEGPQIETPDSGSRPTSIALRDFEPREALAHVLEAIRQMQRELDGRVPLIGFAGAPFTLASYAIEGGHSNNFARTKALMYGDPDAWHRLCARSPTSWPTISRRRSRRAWTPCRCSTPGSARSTPRTIASSPCRTRGGSSTRSAGRVPTIHFGTGTATILEHLREAGGDVIGVDWRIPIDEAWDRIGHDRAVQGNLDPTLLLGPTSRMFEQVDDILRRVGGRPGHIFNLGHGILPSTPVEHVQMLAQYVHSAARRMK